MTERLHFHFSLSCIGEGNGNPLQFSCLENPRDWGQEEKGTTEDEMAGWHHRLDAHMPSLGFSKQEHWSGLPFPSPMQESEK